MDSRLDLIACRMTELIVVVGREETNECVFVKTLAAKRLRRGNLILAGKVQEVGRIDLFDARMLCITFCARIH